MEKGLLLSLSVLFFISQNALAEKDPFGDVTAAQPVCYGREYSTKHMKASPKQTVQKIQAKLSKIVEYKQKILTLEISLKGAKNTYKNYRSLLICDQAGLCQVECDGGSANIRLSQDGQLLLKNNNFAIQGGCGGEGEGEEMMLEGTSGGNDKFRLVRLPVQFCQPVDVRR